MFPDIFNATRLAIDMHGVLDHSPEFFKSMINLMECANREVHIVSGPPKDQIIEELKVLSIDSWYHYDEIHSVVDYLKQKDVKMWQDEKERWWSDGKDWWESKGEICRQIGADVMLDDHIEFKQGFPDDHPTKFILFNYYWKEFFNNQKIK